MRRDPTKCRAILAGLLLFLTVCSLAAASEEPSAARPGLTIDQVDSGSLLIRTTRPGFYLPATILRTGVSIRVNGPIARTHVRQQFENPTGHCVEAVYVFPLPENAAVDTLVMVVGTRRIEGQIQEREEARRTYEAARAEGRKASLLEQHRPNVFTTSLASIGAGERVEIEIEYQQILRWDQGEFRLRFPMVVAPRYGAEPVRSSAGEIVEESTSRTAAPVIPSRGTGVQGRNLTSITIDLDAGFSLRTLESRSHDIDTVRLDGRRYRVSLASGEVPADRDFELTWAPELGSEPRAASFTETIDGETWALVMLLGPEETTAAPRLPRESIFVIDTSGSMSGASLKQARQALLFALDRLTTQDTFNIIAFDSTTRSLFDAPRPAASDTLDEGRRFVRELQAEGGTEMLPALQAALASQQSAIPQVRQVIFMTDGQVSYEQQLFDYIRANLGESRLFTVGIGAAPNSHFMSGAARMGRGTFTYIGDPSEVSEKMTGLFRKLESPVLTDLTLDFGAPGAEVWPARAPDLYLGEPLVVTARLGGAGSASLTGRIGSSSWNATLPLVAGAGSEAGIAKLWARRKIEAVTDSLTSGEDPALVRQQVIETALKHHLVSQYTSLVAVDTTPTGVDPTSCRSELVPINDPAGWGGSDAVGTLPQTATPAPLLMLAGLLSLVVALMVRRLTG